MCVCVCVCERERGFGQHTPHTKCVWGVCVDIYFSNNTCAVCSLKTCLAVEQRMLNPLSFKGIVHPKLRIIGLLCWLRIPSSLPPSWSPSVLQQPCLCFMNCGFKQSIDHFNQFTQIRGKDLKSWF